MLFLHYRVQICKCVFEIRRYRPGILKGKWKERVQMLCILGSFTCGVDSSCNKVSGWTQLKIHIEHLSGISRARNKSFTSSPMNCTVTRRKSFVSRSCPCWLETNVFLPIKIFTPLRVLFMISSRPCSRWCCLVEALGYVATRMSVHCQAMSASLIAGCLPKQKEIWRAGCKNLPLLSSSLKNIKCTGR